MEKLKEILCNLEECVLNQTEDLSKASANELSYATDMIKDISMAMYYQSVAHGMETQSDMNLDEMLERMTDMIHDVDAIQKAHIRKRIMEIANDIA